MATKFNYLAEAIKHAEFVLRKRPMELENASLEEVKKYGGLILTRVGEAMAAVEDDDVEILAVVLHPADVYALATHFGLKGDEFTKARQLYGVRIEELDVPMGYPVLSTMPKDHRGDSPFDWAQIFNRLKAGHATVNESRAALGLPTDPTIKTR